MERLFSTMTLHDIDRFLIGLGFQKTRDEIKKLSNPYNPSGSNFRLLTYAHPNIKPKVKISVIGDVFTVESDCGKKQRTAWKHLETIEEFRQYFML